MDLFWRHLEEALKCLKPRAREVFQQRYLEDLSVDEIAERNNVSSGNVLVILHRARNAVAEHLGRIGYTP